MKKNVVFSFFLICCVAFCGYGPSAPRAEPAEAGDYVLVESRETEEMPELDVTSEAPGCHSAGNEEEQDTDGGGLSGGWCDGVPRDC